MRYWIVINCIKKIFLMHHFSMTMCQCTQFSLDLKRILSDYLCLSYILSHPKLQYNIYGWSFPIMLFLNLLDYDSFPCGIHRFGKRKFNIASAACIEENAEIKIYRTSQVDQIVYSIWFIFMIFNLYHIKSSCMYTSSDWNY